MTNNAIKKEVISMKGINKTYIMGSSEFIALDNITLSIREGEYVAIVGPSGAGKSTLMNIIGCLDTASKGEYVLDGLNTRCSDSKLADIRNKKIGFVFQNYNLLPKLSIIDNVAIPLFYQGVSGKNAREKSKEALKKVGLENHLKHKPTELSGGQKQRVAIARALVTDPQIILADEPTGALDSKTGKEVLQMMKDLNKEGNTIVMITHDRDIASEAERIITVRDGKIMEDIPNVPEDKEVKL
ncbi:ABC transporter ATP-binding protein [Clostridium sp. 19966]|uniref:ABC transporter ATP-binding protein n=1 Tax=Clostridium sp. 19966 TaxID=2768166 RepID=UPI0028DE5528|nr:ABC transporter ATP-binding protein [Clostridium sp. 19966]MDT8717449.1 ABC transporter ATP-binding protein [Clostridium sp. 19966]